MNSKSLLFILAGIVLLSVSSFSQQTSYPFQKTTLPVDERVADLVSRMTLQEKVEQLFNQAPAIERLGVPEYNWWNECLHGVGRAGKATVFPQAIGMAAAFDQDLMFRIGTAISDEARAKHHYFIRNNARSIYMGLTFWSPNINIFRDPRWGRGQETYGEDPYLTARLAVNFIKGLQGNDAKYLKVIATAKHYAVHSGPEFSRHTDNIFINDRDLYDTYLPAFKAAVKEANVQSVMCAYNRFRDQPCCGSDLLLSSILRDEFGFNGYIVSDCGAISDFFFKTSHHVVETPSQALGWSLSSGTDLNCEMNNAFISDHLDSAVNAGIVNEKDINKSLSRLFKARFLLGMFDPDDQVVYSKIPMSVVGSPEHLKLTEEAAEKSLVLLKNNGVLPLQKGRKIALIGPNANNFTILIGNYNGDPVNPVTPLKGLVDRLGKGNVFYTPGCAIVPGVFTDFETVSAENLFHYTENKRNKGLKAEYFADPALKGTPDLVRIDNDVNFVWEKSPVTDVLDDAFGVRWSGVIIAKQSGSFLFGGNLKVKIDDKPVYDKDGGLEKEVILEKGKEYKIEAVLQAKAFWWASNYQQQFAKLTWTETSRDLKKEALDAARKADVIVFCGGISANLEGEEMKLETDGFAHGDRTHINLPEIQEELLKELHKTGKPVIYVNFSGSAIALNWEDENLPAIIQAFYPGEATGTALTRLLFGDLNPSGRLPVTFYKSADQLPHFKNYEMSGRTYRYFKGEPLYPFGYGLSYTTFDYSNLVVSETSPTQIPVSVSVDLKNSGKTAGEEVVQVYVSNKSAKSIVPLTALKAFKRVYLKPGEQKTISFTLNPEDFSVTDNDSRQVVEPGLFEISISGSAHSKNPAVKAINLTGKVASIN